jgi:signal transduction histidine kinase
MTTDATPTAADGAATDRLARLLAVLQKALGHELPNQLVALQGLARLLELEEGERLSPDGRDYLDRLATGAAKAHALVAALAEVARLGRPAAPPEAVDLAEVAAEAVAEAKQLAAGRPAEYHAPEQSLVLTAPRAALRKLLVILLRRAGSAGMGQRPARVEVTVRPCGAGAEICVAGAGVPPRDEAPDRPADPFGGDGRGLDLFLARQLAEGWGGTVRVEPQAGGGAAFVVTCPLSLVPCPLPSAGDKGQGTRDKGQGT